MKSALIACMVNKRWRLGLPMAVVVEKVESGSRSIINSFVCYVISADHSQITFQNKDRSEEYVINFLPEKEIVGYENDIRQWRINTTDGKDSLAIYIGQNVQFARRALAIKEQLKLMAAGASFH